MNNLSRFVYRTTQDGTDVLFHSVTQKLLLPTASEEVLRKHMFFEDQNQEAIRSRLAKQPDQLALNLVTTLECSLRCTHCCVLPILKTIDDDKINPEKLKVFLQRYFVKYPNIKRFQAYFIGGESLLYPQDILGLMQVVETVAAEANIKLMMGTTTNLAFPLTHEHIQVFDKLYNISISIDGFEEEHNTQRKAFKEKGINPFQVTVDNLKRLMLLGYRDKIHVQAALRDNLLTDDYTFRFTKYLTELGVKIENTLIGSIFPTKSKPVPEEQWYNHKTESLFLKNKPCCKYQFMSNIQVNSNGTMVDNYYTTENAYLGTLDDDIETIAQRNVDLIVNHMPALQDKTCLSCPALGYCWGGCVNGHVLIGNKPSLHCNKAKIVPHMQELAIKGRLINNYK